MPKKRIFIAIQIPEELKNILENHLKPFLNNRNLRISKKEGWHITLVFCGYFDGKEIEALIEIVKNVVSESGFMEFAPQRILFAPPLRPRMIWLSFDAVFPIRRIKNRN